jgi:hypothetical protein
MEFLMHGVTLWERITYGSNSSWKERPTGKRVIDEERTDGDSCLKWYAGNPLSSHTHPVGDTREETVGNDRGGLRPVSPTGVEWVGSGTRPISSHSSRFLVSSLVPHSVPRNRLSFVEISPSQVKWRTEQTKDDPRQWKTVRGVRHGVRPVPSLFGRRSPSFPLPHSSLPHPIPSGSAPPGWEGYEVGKWRKGCERWVVGSCLSTSPYRLLTT